ncbi:MAG: response regulator [Neobacillus sp.]
MKFRTLLYVGFGSAIIVMVVIVSIVITMLSNQSKQIDELVKDRYEKIRHANHIRAGVNNIGLEISMVSSEDREIEERQKMIKRINESFLEINESLNWLEETSNLKESNATILEITDQIQEYKRIVNSIIESVSNNGQGNRLVMLEHEGQLSDELTKLIDRLVSIQEKVMEDTITTSNKTFSSALRYTILATIGAVLLGVVMAVMVIRTITGRLYVFGKVMQEIVKGSENYPRLEVKHNDELGSIAATYNEMAHALEEYEKSEQQHRAKLEEQNWIKTRLAELASMSQGLLDLRDFTGQFISTVCTIADAGYGILYIRETNGNQTYLTRLASYAAYNNGSVGIKKIEIGEGLVGQCAADGHTILLKQVPENYIKVGSGLGSTNPSAIIIIPVLYEGEVLAVLELATLHDFSPLHQDLFEQTAEHLGITLNRIQKHKQVQALLEESQTLNEELQTQAEELQVQQEELRTMNDELEAQYNNLELKTKEIEQIKNALEIKNQEIIVGSKYKSEFLANMSHELRTPLNSLIILSQMLSENREGNLDEKQVEYASTIYSSGNDLLKLINEILDLSKIESGKMEVHQGEVILSELLTFTKRQFSPVAKQKGLNFHVRVGDKVPNILYTDEQRLFQIIKNLLSNAFKFTEYGHIELKVDVKVKEGSDSKKAEANYIAFSIIDTGIGIPKEKKDLVFEAFHQADGTTSRKYGGTGLGLSISRDLAQLLKGFIEVESVEGEGSVFTLYIPFEEGNTNVQTDYQQEAAVGLAEDIVLGDSDTRKDKSSEKENSIMNEGLSSIAGRKILIVDDDMRNIFALTSALEGADMHVVFSENGREALQMLSENHDIDLVLMDIMMPEMDGYEAMKRIRQLPEFASIPIIALTAKAMKHDRQKCMDAGASDYISKPVNLEQLFSLLRVWLHK